MKPRELFDLLLQAETEADVDAVLRKAGLDNDSPDVWHPFGGMDNNFGAIGNQQAEPTAALVEKIINAIDAVLMAKAFARGVKPDSDKAPQTMRDAVASFFGVRDGKFENVTADERTKVAELIHLVAVGPKSEPNYLIVDRGEGQTPNSFPDTLVSLLKSNKMRIPFVQGKFNAGGTGILQFCGARNYQLILSRRNPDAPVAPSDISATHWGFTLVRRMPPAGTRRSSTYVYLRPNGVIPSFDAKSVAVLPGPARGQNKPPLPYAGALEFGTCIKLYNYRWRAKSTATTEARYELERFLHSPAIPFRITETRDYRANYYSTTLSGVWVSIGASKAGESDVQVESGFPAYADLTLQTTGRLPYSIVVYQEGIDPRHAPHGIFFTVNGQVHGALPSDFVSRRLKFDYLKDHLMVSVDCTQMPGETREDLFMASRDRIRHNEVSDAIADELERELRDHPGLKQLNAERRAKRIAQSIEDNREAADVLQQLLHIDPSLAALLGIGPRLKVRVGPGDPKPFNGRRFPTFFKFAKDPDQKSCPLNKSIRVDFVTDANNDYFSRPDSPGELKMTSSAYCEHSSLWNGEFSTKWRVPPDAKVGDLITVSVAVTDVQREAAGDPFVNEFVIRVAAAENPRPPRPGPRPTPSKREPNQPDSRGRKFVPELAMPKIVDVPREAWPQHSFDDFTGLRVKHAEEGKFDFFVNADNANLMEQLKRAQPSDHKLVRYWFKYGLALCALGMLQEDRRIAKRHADEDGGQLADPDLDAIGRYTDGVARVIVPIVRTLYRGPQPN